jgi:hypothetical protein
VSAQAQQNGGRKRADAVRVPAGSIRVDGRLDDSAWGVVPPLMEFVQREPVEGAPPTDRMEVRFAYDDNALYIGARMYSGAGIQAPMGRRDEGDQAEYFGVFLDTYLDRRTASAFGVTAAGVRLDEFSHGTTTTVTPGTTPYGSLARRSTRKAGWRNCGFRSPSFASRTRIRRCGDSTSRDGSRRATRRSTGR